MISLVVASLLLQGSTNPGAVPDPPTTPVTKSGSSSFEDWDNNKIQIETKVTATFTLGAPTIDKNFPMADMYCNWDCAGEKHKAHADCHYSCDVPCLNQHKHEKDVKAMVVTAYEGPSSAVTPKEFDLHPSAAYWRSSSVKPTSGVASEALGAVLKPYYEITRHIKTDCFANQCSNARRYWGAKKYELTGHYHTTTTITTAGVAKTYEQDSTGVAARIYVLDDTSEPRTVQFLTCKCEKPNMKISYGQFIRESGSCALASSTIDQNAVFTGGLNGVHFTPPGPLGQHTFFFPGGMLLMPENDGDQMLLFLYDDYEDWSDAAQCNPWGKPAKDFPVVCLQMNKRMPTNSTFHAKPCADDNLKHIAELGSHDLMRGRYDQTRFWIYTDKATLADVQAHEMLPVSASDYLKCLYEDDKIHALDFSQPSYQRCVTPDLLEGLQATAAAKAWLVQRLDEFNPQGFAAYLKANAAKFTPMLATPAGQKQMAELADALAGSTTSEVHEALPKFLGEAIPKESRRAILSQCKRL